MPRISSSVILAVAVISGIVAFLLSMRFVNPERNKKPQLMVVGAVKDIELGSKITREHLDLFPAPQNISPKVMYNDLNGVVGRVSRRSILKGEVIRSMDLLGKGENLASLIPKGYRAVTIPVQMPPDMLTLLNVGNRVDVLMTYRSREEGMKTIALAEAAKVIGVSDKGGNFASRKVVIGLAVTPEGAETITFSLKRGNLSIAVRSALETDGEEQEKFFALKELFGKEELELPPPEKKEFKPVDSIEIIRGLRKQKHSFNRPKTSPGGILASFGDVADGASSKTAQLTNA